VSVQGEGGDGPDGALGSSSLSGGSASVTGWTVKGGNVGGEGGGEAGRLGTQPVKAAAPSWLSMPGATGLA
jgi:hypothetical protein